MEINAAYCGETVLLTEETRPNNALSAKSNLGSEKMLYRSESDRNFIRDFICQKNDDYIACIGFKLAEKWAENMQLMMKSQTGENQLDAEKVAKSLEMAKERIAPCYISQENTAVAKAALVAHWVYGEEFGELVDFKSEEIQQIRGIAEVQVMLHKNYETALMNEKISFDSPIAARYWDFKINGCDVIDKDCFALAGDWIKVSQLLMKAAKVPYLSDNILYESGLLVRRYNPLAMTSDTDNILKIRGDYYQKVVQAMICCWDKGKEVGRIHSTDDKNVAAIRHFPYKDSSFMLYAKRKRAGLLGYFVDKLAAKVNE
jgi:hypothetical protein